MTPVSIQISRAENLLAGFLAVGGKHKGFGKSPGEALNALVAQEAGSIDSSLVLIHRFGADSHFSQAQHDQMIDLMQRRDNLSKEDELKLDTLIDEELEATISRIKSFRNLQKSEPYLRLCCRAGESPV